jgi:hypothetical protein
VKKLSDILIEKIPTQNQDFHFCKIDVEGFEKAVLEGINFDIIKPWVFVIESTEPYTSISTHEEWEHILINAGYIFVLRHNINRYYLIKSRNELADRFLSIDIIHEIYEIYRFKYNDEFKLDKSTHNVIGKLINRHFRNPADDI